MFYLWVSVTGYKDCSFFRHYKSAMKILVDCVMFSLGYKSKSEIARSEDISFWIKYYQIVILHNVTIYVTIIIKHEQVISAFKGELILKSTYYI